MSGQIDSHPGEEGELWRDPSLFDIYNTHRGVLREAQTNIVQKALDSYVSADGMIAEIGSGAGHLYSMLPESYKSRVIGIEGTPVFVTMQKQKFPESSVAVGNAYSLPLSNESVRAVLSYSVFDTLQDLEKAVAETKRVLQKSGRFIHFLDIQPNFGILVKDIPVDQIPFLVHRNGAFDRFVLVSRADYETKVRPRLNPQKKPLFDLLSRDPVNMLGYLQATGGNDIIIDVADTIDNMDGIEKTETPVIKDKFKDRLTEELKRNGFKIVSDEDMSETMDVTPNPAHQKNVGKNLFVGDVGNLWTKNDSDVPPGKVREQASLQVLVAEKL